MTPEQQRIKIAEACGWKAVKRGKWFGRVVWWYRKGKVEIPESQLPDYLNDLNAMHEAEKFLTNDQWLDYDLELMVVTNCDDIVQKKRISATAKQRAEAFRRTLNLWEP